MRRSDWVIAKRSGGLKAVRWRDLHDDDQIAVSNDGAFRARKFSTAREAKNYIAGMDIPNN